MSLREMNFDGLVGPTHNYAGLSRGNVASRDHGGEESHPRAAALQGIAKMRAVAARGFDQGILPPLARPAPDMLRRLGYSGTDASVLARAAAEDAVLLAQVCSASSMWTANAATVSPSVDTTDGRVHFTPANLRSQFHRSIEPQETGRLLSTIFADASRFAHHPPLPASDQYGDEGAANHTRLETAQGVVHLFVYGIEARRSSSPRPQRFPARQTLEASQAIARQHGLQQALFVQQDPKVIDRGVFHNDVISVGTGRVLLMHERAFSDGPRLLAQLAAHLGETLIPVIVTEDELPVDACVSTYLFNSQLLQEPDGSMVLIAPAGARDDDRVERLIGRWIEGPLPIRDVVWTDVRESMSNGGGPACLRLRVPLTDAERAAVHPGAIATPQRLDDLTAWVERWYPENLLPEELADPLLLRSCRDALQALTDLLDLGPIYHFQS